MVLRGIIAVVLAALLIYGGFRAYPLLRGPAITLSSPIEGSTSPSGFILLSGVAHHTETLTLNGGPLLIDEKGRFKKELLLPEGTSMLMLSARDRFGRTTNATRTVFVPLGTHPDMDRATSTVPLP